MNYAQTEINERDTCLLRFIDSTVSPTPLIIKIAKELLWIASSKIYRKLSCTYT
ncbi:hypothetical protein VCR3J2_70129 [Vibrio coralliirubri]|nr:hypothetical protein VCR3J2_70129 [Vibrio coralliirubri]